MSGSSSEVMEYLGFVFRILQSDDGAFDARLFKAYTSRAFNLLAIALAGQLVVAEIRSELVSWFAEFRQEMGFRRSQGI